MCLASEFPARRTGPCCVVVVSVWRAFYLGECMTDQQIDEFLEMLARSPTSARDMVRGLFAANEAKAAPAEPFGYFRAEPFGWTDCSADDEGAIALYERPAAPAVPQGEPVAWIDMSKMSSSAMVYATGWKSNDKQSPLYTAAQSQEPVPFDQWNSSPYTQVLQETIKDLSQKLASMTQSQPVRGMPDVATWLWFRFVDYCRKQSMAPRHQKGLFAIVHDLRTMLASTTPPVHAAAQEPVTLTDELLEALRECVDSLWVIDSHVVDFDGSVRFDPYYDFSGLDGIDRHEFLAEHSCVVWPSCGKWSAYCTYDGATWFELFDSADAAKEKCMELLDRVMPTHPAMKARAIIAALSEKGQAK